MTSKSTSKRDYIGGTNVCVEHLAAIKVVDTVKTKICCLDQDRMKLHFSVKACYQDKSIRIGTYDRFMIDEAKFLERL